MNIELKPCPFCGHRTAPEVISMAELDSIDGNERDLWYAASDADRKHKYLSGKIIECKGDKP